MPEQSPSSQERGGNRRSSRESGPREIRETNDQKTFLRRVSTRNRRMIPVVLAQYDARPQGRMLFFRDSSATEPSSLSDKGLLPIRIPRDKPALKCGLPLPASCSEQLGNRLLNACSHLSRPGRRKTHRPGRMSFWPSQISCSHRPGLTGTLALLSCPRPKTQEICDWEAYLALSRIHTQVGVLNRLVLNHLGSSTARLWRYGVSKSFRANAKQKRDRGCNYQPLPRPQLNSQPQGAIKGLSSYACY